ncbi:hypothetical protein RYH80_06575 [Halobaculum sp. MBLA0147]|uniref:hypothetical protein n=1 Tax=Halobaculum sp. MBLA0147 TaxID=3079934 RepID=UPI003523EB29
MSALGRLVETVIGSAAAAGSDATYDHEATETLRFERPPSVSVEATNGHVDLRTHRTTSGAGDETQHGDDDAVETETGAEGAVVVEVTRRAQTQAGLERLSVVATGGDEDPLQIRADHPADADGEVSFAVRVPSTLPVTRVETTNGSVETVDARVGTVTTTHGRVDVRDGSVERVTTENGSVAVTDTDGDVSVRTTNGSVTLARVDGVVDVETTNGSVSVDEPAAVGRLVSTAGGIDAHVPAIDGDTTVRTRTGSVTLELGRDLDATVSASTTLGTLRAPAIDSYGAGAGSIGGEAVVGDGGPELAVSTRLGSVTVNRRV